MVSRERADYQELIEKTIHYLEGRGYSNIKADIEGYESPKSFKMPSQGIEITPDIVADTKGGKTQYIEVGVKTDHPRLLKTKWKFLKTISQMKNRGFGVISHRGHYSFSDQIMKELEFPKRAVRI